MSPARVLPLLAALACSTSPAGVPLDELFTLAPGQTAGFEDRDIAFTFVAVESDSRCPEGDFVQCVWEGNAEVVLRVTGGPEVTEVTLHTYAEFGSQATYPGFVIRLERLTPLPTVDGPPEAQDYRASFRVGEVN